ncbi:MAG: tetratricopeptide repeat protein [Bacteroidetes bacterium]|nr:tetratricopeptide repeat protein [Bacteroidota bacterium]
MNYKLLLLILLFFQITINSYSQTIQKGRVLEKDSHRTPIENAEIVVKNAAPANSGTDGKYKLVFKRKTQGEIIFVDSICKKGYELVNETQIKDWILSDIKDFDIILCKEGLLKESREHFYHIGKSHYEDEFKRKSSEIVSLKLANKISENEYNKKLKEILDEKQKSIEQLNYYSDLLSRYNTDDLSEIEQKAYQFSKDGRIDEAIQVYENEKLLTKFIKNESLKQQFNTDLESMVPSIRRYAELCAFAGGYNNYDKASECYKAIALSDTTNFDYVFDFALFLSTEWNHNDAIKWYKIALRYVKNNYQDANVLNLLAVSEYYMKLYSDAQKNYILSLELSKNTKWINNISLKARTLDNLGVLYQTLEQYDKAEMYHSEALGNYKKIVQSNPTLSNKYDLAKCLNNFATYYHKIEQYKYAEDNFIKSINIYKELADSLPDTYCGDLADAYHSYAFLLQDTKQYEKAENNLLISLNLFSSLCIKDDHNFRNVALSYKDLAELYINIGQYDKAELKLQFITDNYKKWCSDGDLAIIYNLMGIAKKKLGKYNEALFNYNESLILKKEWRNSIDNEEKYNYSVTVNNLGVLLYEIQNYDSADINLIEALNIRTELEKANKAKYVTSILETLSDIISLKMRVNQYKQAEIYIDKELDIYRELSKIYPSKYKSIFASILFNASTNYFEMQFYEKTIEVLNEDLGIVKQLAKNNPENYNEDIPMILINIANLRYSLRQFDQAQKTYIEALDNYKSFAKTDPIKYDTLIAELLNTMAWIFYKNNLPKAISNALEAIKLYNSLILNNPDLKSKLSICMARMSRYMIINHQFSEGERYANKSIETNNTINSSYKNLAHSLLYQGKYQDALNLYTKIKSDVSLKTQILSDFDEFEKAGITHPDVLKIREILNNK